MKIIKELHVLVGLPGSGKTYFANQYRNQGVTVRGCKYADVIDYDAIYQKAGTTKTGEINKEKVEKMSLPHLKYDILILDGLFITQEDVEWVLGLYFNNPKFTECFNVEKIVVDYWVPDKEACLWNDRGRRTVDSVTSIKMLNPEKIDIKKIEEKFGIKTKLELHSVVRKPAYKIMAEENGVRSIKDKKYLESDPWCLGGEAWSWTGEKWSMSAENPCNFDQLDDLLEKICPTITFLQYKRLYSKCVALEERYVSDYYSNCTEGYWRCDLEKLYAMLEEMGIYKVVEKFEDCIDTDVG